MSIFFENCHKSCYKPVLIPKTENAGSLSEFNEGVQEYKKCVATCLGNWCKAYNDIRVIKPDEPRLATSFKKK